MELQRLLIWVCFAICLGLTAGGVLIFFRMKALSGLSALRYFQYYLIMCYAYAYYAMWSDVFVQMFFITEREDELISKISNLLVLVSAPFLLIGLIMLVAWSLHMRVKKSSSGVLTSIIVSLTVILFIGWQLYLADSPFGIETVFALLIGGVVFFISTQLYSSSVRYLGRKHRIIITTLLLGVGCIQLLSVSIAVGNEYVKLGYIILYFLLNTAIGSILVYAGTYPEPLSPEDNPESFDTFFSKYGITPREQEVILEIYKGKTNREIADTLFVTVQTIKDHTHRIYQKTAVRNRNQLASLLRNLEKEA